MMDGKFLAATAMVAAAGFSAVWFATEPADSEVPRMVSTASLSPATTVRPKPRIILEAPPEDMQPVSAFLQATDRRPIPKARSAASVYYSGCNAARAAGVAPIYRGGPGYRPEMDGDNDGIACEPHR